MRGCRLYSFTGSEQTGIFHMYLELNKNFLMLMIMIVQGSRKLKESEKEMRPDLCLPDLYLQSTPKQLFSPTSMRFERKSLDMPHLVILTALRKLHSNPLKVVVFPVLKDPQRRNSSSFPGARKFFLSLTTILSSVM